MEIVTNFQYNKVCVNNLQKIAKNLTTAQNKVLNVVLIGRGIRRWLYQAICDDVYSLFERLTRTLKICPA